ncbi:alpha/beta fold hydrolase [Pontibacter akesuensis]|nr:alpha/beta hydrolase [Pontibacter akesuensis]GHA56117.1 alpha/beta hydrolase [Pontibacter akesuensis]
MEILVTNRGTTLYTLLFPNPGKETVILLHGGPAAPEDLGPVIDFLAPHYQVIYFHQRGTRKSPCPADSYSMKEYVADIDSIAAHFSLQQFHLFGHSWGGLYAQIYAAQSPNRLLSAFLCSPASGTGKQWAETVLEIADFNRKKSSLPEILSLGKDAALGLLGNDEAYKEFQTQFARNCNKGYEVSNTVPVYVELLSATAINSTVKEILRYPILPRQPHPGYKITITYGDDDIYGDSPRYVRERYPTATVAIIPRSSHFQWLHNPEAFFHVLAAHFDLQVA